jgi:hypothetical protein
MKCKICEVRKPRRWCPGVRAEICSQCCGTEREVTVDCPFECEYLQQAWQREKPPQVAPGQLPNSDIRLTDKFIREQEELITVLGAILLESAMEVPGAVDYDVREALEALIRTYRTLESGLYYETKPENPLASAIQQGFQKRVQDMREKLVKNSRGSVRDADVLGGLAFLQRLGLQHDYGRRRGRALLGFLRGVFPKMQPPEDRGTLIQI